jgi:hypothetical protein
VARNWTGVKASGGTEVGAKGGDGDVGDLEVDISGEHAEQHDGEPDPAAECDHRDPPSAEAVTGSVDTVCRAVTRFSSVTDHVGPAGRLR